MIAAQLKVIADRPAEEVLPPLREDGAGARPQPPDPRQHGGRGLLAYVLVSKFDDHFPLYRLNEIFARMGADIPDSTLVDWCGRAMKVLQPADRADRGGGHGQRSAPCRRHPDPGAGPIPARQGLGKGVKKGRIWAYVRDQRPWAGTAPPGAVYHFAPDWKEEHVHHHLAQTRGILQADGYKGYAKLYEPGPDGDAPLPGGGLLGASAPRLS